ncbi:unnamed protein product [Porites evermanni]|uniref:Uncharacterized protein n=1 Tax=Porites evermanni TaxID=104178 RepID=A0ABN8RYS2_9CNID|nr:unnamed protein product [Porites evermanni]
MLLGIRKGDRFRWSLVHECGPCTATQKSRRPRALRTFADQGPHSVHLLKYVYGERSEKCRLYSEENNEMDIRSQPMFLSVTEVDEAACAKDGNSKVTLWCLMI